MASHSSALKSITIANPVLQASVKTVLAESLVCGEFVDVRFFLFTRRQRSGKVCTPRALYANSAVLKAASPYFVGMLAGGFSESSVTGNGTGFPADQPSVMKADPYAAEDSDYEDEDEDDESGDPKAVQDMRDEVASGSNAKAAHPAHSIPASPASATAIEQPGGRPLRTIVIKDAALTTWQWLVYYLYTGEIAFAPLQSQGAEYRATERKRYQTEHPQHPPLCSPKSMYRLADMLGIDRLKSLAADNIRSKLSAESVLDEIFSKFSSWYPDILAAEMRFFSDKCLNAKMLPRMRKKLALVAAEPMPYAAEAIASLFEACLSDRLGELGVEIFDEALTPEAKTPMKQKDKEMMFRTFSGGMI